MRGTKRSLNKCKDCGDTWYPRGRSVSNKCPRCGSTNVDIDYTGLIVGAILLGIVLVAWVGHMIAAGFRSETKPLSIPPSAPIAAPPAPASTPAPRPKRAHHKARHAAHDAIADE